MSSDQQIRYYIHWALQQVLIIVLFLELNIIMLKRALTICWISTLNFMSNINS